MKTMSFASAILALSITTGAFAQSYDFTIDVNASSSDRTTGVALPFAGTMIGDWNETENPDGTQTRPGLFGGSGNQPIDYGANFSLDGSNQSVPSGTFSLEVDRKTGLARMNGLVLDILGGQPEELDSTLTINYETFRTFNPSSLFPGGFDIPVPLGSINVNAMDFMQTGEAELLLTVDDAGITTITGLVPGELSLEIVVLDQDFGAMSFPTAFPISAELIENDNGAQLVIQSSFDLDQEIPAADEPFADIPIELPTVLPPGSLASLLISGTTGTGSITGGFSIALVADGDASGCAEDPDLNGDGAVDGTDLTILLGNWNAPGGLADINCDDIVDGTDLTLLLGFWSA
jgi:hypothetical protein